MIVQLALYKGAGDWSDALIRAWTQSRYSHCELVLPDGRWVSSSPRDGGVRVKRIAPEDEIWDFVPLPWLNARSVEALFEAEQSAKYDWRGILASQMVPFGIQSDSRWFCSEFCAAAMGIAEPQRYSPGQLWSLARWGALLSAPNGAT